MFTGGLAHAKHETNLVGAQLAGEGVSEIAFAGKPCSYRVVSGECLPVV
jgi:hypothetical protein